MYREEYEQWERAVSRIVQTERDAPVPGRYSRRAERIKVLHAAMDAGHKQFAQITKTTKRKPKFFTDTDEWKSLAVEFRLLHDVQREHAYLAGWPIWQERQHTHCLTVDGELRTAEVKAFDLDRQTIDVRHWVEGDFCGYLGMPNSTSREETITLQQIIDGIQRHEENKRERVAEAQERKREAEREALPLFAAQI